MLNLQILKLKAPVKSYVVEMTRIISCSRESVTISILRRLSLAK